MNIIKIVISLLLISSCNGQFLRLDSFSDATCSPSSAYSNYFIKLDHCNGQYVYRYVPANVGSGQSSGTPTGGVGTTIDLTSVVTQVATLGLLTNEGMMTAAITAALSVSPVGGNLNVNNLVNADSQGAGTSTAQTSLPTTSLPTSTLPSSSVPTSIGNLATLGALTDVLTALVTEGLSSGIPSVGATTGLVNSPMGRVAQYFCLAASGCRTQCIEIKSFPLGSCQTSGLNHVMFSITNKTDLVTVINNQTNPGPNNGFCQSSVSPQATCAMDPTEFSQSINNYCGQGSKVNCTSSVYSSYSCIDAECNQCTKVSSVPLNECIIVNKTGMIFKSILKTPIEDTPIPLTPTPSEEPSHSNAYDFKVLLKSTYLLLSLLIGTILIFSN